MPLVYQIYHDGVVSELRHREVWYGATYRLHMQSRMYPEDGGTMLLRTEHVLQTTVPNVGQWGRRGPQYSLR